ncbi:hypothetical protein JZ751_013768 [Albula glossodonta]|uniref:Uncharacterized protein n=1 Tax=Albula glossodonta TaxID=121402 RepID=A0A8T2P1T7_9TELE|nr:hypothetical protein JZ751_013768 [Albula glossodonta]
MRRHAAHPLGQIMSTLSKDAGGRAERAKAQVPVSSVGEDRAILLGLSMIGFSLLTYFLFGNVLVIPYLRSIWTEECNCTVIKVGWTNSTGDFGFPCLRVVVNLSLSADLSQRAMLHYNEDTIDLPVKCFYIPKNQQNRTARQEEAQFISEFFQAKTGIAIPCLIQPMSDEEGHWGDERNVRDVAIVTRKYSGWLVARYMSWPTLMLVGGVVTIGLVRLSQQLSYMAAQLGPQVLGEGETIG